MGRGHASSRRRLGSRERCSRLDSKPSGGTAHTPDPLPLPERRPGHPGTPALSPQLEHLLHAGPRPSTALRLRVCREYSDVGRSADGKLPRDSHTPHRPPPRSSLSTCADKRQRGRPGRCGSMGRRRPADGKGPGSIPVEGTYLGCRLEPQSWCGRQPIQASRSHRGFSLRLSPSLRSL